VSARGWQREVAALVDAALGGAPAAAIGLAPGGRLDCRAAGGDGWPPGASGPRGLGDPLPFADGSLASVAVTLLAWTPADGPWRPLLEEARRVLGPGGRLVLVDHNRPRRRWPALLAVVRAPAPPGPSPAARWRRLAHPAAREAQAAGFVVDALRLAAGERVQVVSARPRPS
jgi:SAM-dependent methyltransferase